MRGLHYGLQYGPEALKLLPRRRVAAARGDTSIVDKYGAAFMFGLGSPSGSFALRSVPSGELLSILRARYVASHVL